MTEIRENGPPCGRCLKLTEKKITLFRNWAVGLGYQGIKREILYLLSYFLRRFLVSLGLRKCIFVCVSSFGKLLHTLLQSPRFLIWRYEMISECNNLMIQQILCCKTRAAIIKSLEYWLQFFSSQASFFPTQSANTLRHTHSQIYFRRYLIIPNRKVALLKILGKTTILWHLPRLKQYSWIHTFPVI